NLKSLLPGVDGQALDAPQHERHRLDRRPDDVVEGLLVAERRPARAGEPEETPGASVARAEALTHQPSPDPAAGAVLGDLFEEVHESADVPGDPRRELIDVQASVERAPAVLDRIGDRERHLLDRSGARLADVVPADRDRI